MLHPGLATHERNIYNQLGTVEDSFAALTERTDFRAFLDSFQHTAAEHKMLGKVGVFLLHRHFLVSEMQILLETPGVLGDGTEALFAAPADSNVHSVYRPCRWMLASDGSFIALEFSTDQAVHRNYEELTSAYGFLGECAGLLERFEFADLLGLCLPNRTTLVATEERILVEETTPDASVVKVMDRTSVASTCIPTSWVPTAAPFPSPTMLCEVIMGCVPTGCSVRFGNHVRDHAYRQTGHIQR